MARLNADWSLDTGFTTGTGADNGAISTIVVQPDQKILVGGSFTRFSGQAAPGLVRLLPGGSIDPAFSYAGPGNVTRILPLANGEYLVIDSNSSEIRWHATSGALVRLLPLPESLRALLPPEPSYSVTLTSLTITTNPVEVAELKDGTILAVFRNTAAANWIRGSTAFGSRASEFVYLAYGSDGLPLSHAISEQTRDISSEGPLATTRIIPAPSGSYYIFDNLLRMPYPGTRGSLRRFNADGTLDPAFSAPAMTMSDLGWPEAAIDSSGNLIVSGGQFLAPAGFASDTLSTVRLLDNGSMDPVFGLPFQASSGTSWAALKRGTVPSEDRIILYVNGALVAFKPTNGYTLGPASTLPPSQAVTTGKGVTFTANQAGTMIQWQISTDGGLTWKNLADDSSSHGTTTATLDILNASPALNGALFRYASTTNRGVLNSNATTLTVNPQVFPHPVSIGIDGANNLYVGDTAIHTIQKISPTLQVVDLAGASGQTGAEDGLGTSARFNQPAGLTTTSAGELTVSDTANAILRRVTAAGEVSTLAGASTARGNVDGPGPAARFSAPIGIARNAAGVFYVADSTNHTIRMVAPDGTVTTLAGAAGTSGASDGTGAAARFNNPTGVAVDASGNVFVTDTTNNLIRKITPAGVVTTVAGVTAIAGSHDGPGNEALFNQPGGIGLDDSGNLYVADTGNSTVRKITPAGVVSTLAGLPTVGGIKDGTGFNAWFNQPKSLTVAANGDIYVADTGNAAIRKINVTGLVTTLNLSLSAPLITTQPAGLAVAAGSPASFRVAATGSSPLSYQWRKNGTPLADATATSYAFSAVTASDAGNYSVVISNAAGSVTSSAAMLTVDATTPSTPSIPSTPNQGGGGAISPWFLGALSLLMLRRGRRCRPR